MRVTGWNIQQGLRPERVVALMVALAVMWLAAPAQAQSRVDSEAGGTVVMDRFVLDQLYGRLERLERDMQGMVRTGKVPAGGGSYPSAGVSTVAADQQIKITALEEELAQVTGELETVRHKLDRLQDRMGLMQKDVEYRLSALEKNKAPGLSEDELADEDVDVDTEAEAEATAGVDPTVAAGGSTGFELPEGAPAEKYNYAIGLLRQGAYSDAEGAFRAFLDSHPEDDLASNASYWLGETYYVRNQYKEAAGAFLSGLKSYPKGNKASQSMLKLGITLMQLGHNEQGCVTLVELDARFPDAPDKVKSRAAEERKKADCG